MKKKVVRGMMLTLIILGMLTFPLNIQPVKSDPTTWIVDDDGEADFHSIQEAVFSEIVENGDTIYVRNGTYYETVVVNKILTLIGQHKRGTIINGSGFQYVGALVTIVADHVDMSRFTVTNARQEGILFEDKQYCEVHDNVVCFIGDRGIVVTAGGNNKFYDNIVYNSSAYGGIEAIGSDNNTIYNNIAYFNQWGIATNHGSYNHIYNNTVYSNRGTGIHIDWPSTGNVIYNNNVSSNTNTGIGVIHQANGTIISGNEISGSFCGVHLDETLSNSFSGNIVRNNAIGIELYVASNNVISGNTITTNYNSSILLSFSSNNLILENYIINNGDGVALFLSYNNSFYHNNFINSTSRQVHMHDQNSYNFWDDGYISGGNYWSDYNGTDLYSGQNQNKPNRDGIGDSPYIIDNHNKDNYPLMNPWPRVRSTRYSWTMFHHNLRHTGYTKSPAPNTNQTLWNYTTGDWVYSSPAVADGRVYVGSFDNKTYCLDALTGAHIWNYTTGVAVVSSPAVADGKVYVGSYDRKVYCLDATTGAHIWNYTTGDAVVSSPAVADGKVYVGSYDRKVYCLDATTGDFVWSYTTGDIVFSSPAVAAGKVYFGSHDRKVYCLDATTGDFVWSYTTGWAVLSSPTVADGMLFVGSGWGDNKVYCLDAATGAHIWNYTTGDAVYSSPAVADGRVYIGSDDGKVYCLDALTGHHVWDYTTGYAVFSSPAVAAGKVYFGSHDRKVYCLDATTGDFVWSYTTGDTMYSSPAVADGMVFIGSYDNKVYAFGNVIRVPEDYPTVQEAIDAADEGATIIVAPGTYYNQSMVINKTLTIIGLPGSEPIFDGGGSGIAITLLPSAFGSTITGIVITNWDQGIFIVDSSDCKIYGNIMSLMDESGIVLQGNNAANNLIYNNIFQGNTIAINLTESSTNNIIYSNNFFNNAIQVYTSMPAENIWDNGYPSGGNYWSDFEDRYPSTEDIYSGPYQNIAGSDGIWDHPYEIAEDNVDRYPLVKPFSGIGITEVTTSKTVIGQGYTLRMDLRILNYGIDDEISTVTVDANTITIATLTNTLLTSRNFTTITFTWNTVGFAKGNYTITVRATPVPSETDLDDNSHVDGWVVVTILGDVNGDFEVDVFDKVLVGAAFGANYNAVDGMYWHQPPDFPGPCPYCPHSPNADINGDLTIDVFDKVIVGYHFGETNP